MPKNISFHNTEIGFSFKTSEQLKFSYRMLRLMSSPFLVKLLSSLTVFALKLNLPITWAVKKTIYRQFCGGETIQECLPVIEQMGMYNVKSILDYSSEAKHTKEDFELTTNQVLKSIAEGKDNEDIVCACIKITGICDFEILEKVSAGEELDKDEAESFNKGKKRLDDICKNAHNNNIQIFIDAEESWIQPAIDAMAEKMMELYNQQKPIVFTTLQMYRHDRIAYLNTLLQKSKTNKYILSIKLVRGAYLEKENKRAEKMGYPTPMQPNKKSTDIDYNNALKTLIKCTATTAICAGTHNEKSSLLLIKLMKKFNIYPSDERIQFSQLYGMSDHISYNLAAAGYNVTKYLPYGPVKSAIPYLVRRAQENTSIAGQMSKELRLTVKEMIRRKLANA